MGKGQLCAMFKRLPVISQQRVITVHDRGHSEERQRQNSLSAQRIVLLH